VQTKTGPGFIKYHGFGANLSIYNPSVVGSQYSLGHIRLQNGPESIQVGWLVSLTCGTFSPLTCISELPMSLGMKYE